jgi:prealbumin domain-containing protein
MRFLARKVTGRWRPVTALALIISVTGAIALVQSGGAHTSGDTSISDPGFSFTADVQGANDQPGQKDLTAHATYLTLNDLYVGWKWDDTGLSGTNTGDGCALFDTDGDGKVNGALCVTISGAAATWQSTRVYTCGDTKNDRCTSGGIQVMTITSKCSVTDHATATFGSGTDTQATCKVGLADFQGTVANTTMLNTCSYPSQQPNSAPNDCVLIPGVLPNGAIEITKTGDDADCTGPATPTANCQSAGVSVLSGAHFEIKDPGGNVVSGAGDLVTGSNGKVCFAGLPVSSTAYTVNEKTAPSGYSIDDTDGKSVSVTTAGNCTSGAQTVTFTDTRLTGAIEITKTGDDANCTGPATPTANCRSAGVSVLSGAHFEIKDSGGNVVSGAGDLVTGSNGKVCFAGLPISSNAYTVNETTAPSGYAIDDTDGKSVSVTSAGDCTSGGGAATIGFTDSPVSKFRVIFTPPASGVTEAQIECDVDADTENGDPDTTGPPTRDDTDETYSDLPAGTYTCTIDIAEP